jgi:CheY-like chemotaxis protein
VANAESGEFAGKKVLIIDDEPDVVAYLEAFLGDLGFRTVSAPDALRGSELAVRENPDLITLDISMPEKSGGKFLRELQEDPRTASIPVVVVTGVMEQYRGFIHHRKHVKPPQGYIQKPIERDELVATLRRVLGG